MTYVTICSGEKGELLSCKATGHSGFAKYGSDIVCATLSVLLRTAVLYLEQRCSFDEKLRVELSAQKKGCIEFEVLQYGEASSNYLIFLFEFLKIGFSGLVSEYPEFVSLECSVRKE